MNGHRTPCHTSAGHHSPSARQRTLSSAPSLATFLLAILLIALLTAGSLLVAGCGSDGVEAGDTTATTAPAAAFPVTVTDDNGASVTVEAEPMRIVSTSPASTETLFALGLGDRVVGVSSLCDYPSEVAGIAKVGDYAPNTEAIMVGDDWLNDIVPAERAGLNTFWGHEDGATREPVEAHPDGSGTLET